MDVRHDTQAATAKKRCSRQKALLSTAPVKALRRASFSEAARLQDAVLESLWCGDGAINGEPTDLTPGLLLLHEKRSVMASSRFLVTLWG